MSVSEWCIYVMTNPAMPGIVKVGGSTCPDARADQLSSGTGIPLPFVVEFTTWVDFGSQTEVIAHRALAEHRVSPSREFFRVSVDEAIEAIHAAALLANWNKAGKEAREQFLERVGASA